VPGPQGTQSPAAAIPEPDWYAPAGQAAQTSGAEAPAAAEYVPAAHGAHASADAAPAPVWYPPAAQAAQASGAPAPRAVE
jgi:hypothetical protein